VAKLVSPLQVGPGTKYKLVGDAVVVEVVLLVVGIAVDVVVPEGAEVALPAVSQHRTP
jgi:hypothetical protein